MISLIGRIAIAAPILAGALCMAATSLRADVTAGIDEWSRGDYAAAVQEWQALATQGDPAAMFHLGQAYKFGKGVPQNLAKAEELFGEAATKGQVQAADNYGLLRFQRGDQTGALPYIEAAAGRGDARARYLLGISYFNGDIVPKSWIHAYALATLAQQSGLSQASSAIAQMDTHIPLEQREQAASLALRIAAETGPLNQPVLSALVDFTQPAVLPVVDTRPAKPALKSASQATSASGRWRVQLGVFSVRANADALWNKLKRRPELSGHARVDASSGKLTRLLAGGFASQDEATEACSRISGSGYNCLVIRN